MQVIGVDHVAFRTRSLGVAKSRLDPAGVKVELAFDPTEHQG